MERRAFLSLSAMTLSGFSCPSEILSILNCFGYLTEGTDPTKSQILAVVEADRLSSDSKQSRNLLALPNIYASYKLKGGSPSPAELQQLFDKGEKLDRPTLTNMPDYFQIQNPEQLGSPQMLDRKTG